MNARAYIKILRPGRTLGLAAVYGVLMPWNQSAVFFASTRTESLFFALALTGPLTLGALLLGPIHEVMHRSFFPTLPGARHSLRRCHAVGVAIAALLLFVPAALAVTDVPKAALAGWIVAGLSLPLLNIRHRVWRRWQFLGFLLAAVALALATPAVIHLSQKNPWMLLLASLGCAAASFRIGFAASQVSDRWRDPNFFSFQSLFPFVGSKLAKHSQAQAHREAQIRNPRPSRAWTVHSVGPNIRDWSKAFNFARTGALSPLRLVLPQVPVALIPYLLAAFFGTVFARALDKAPRALVPFCQQYLEATQRDGPIAEVSIGLSLLTPPVFAGIIVFVAAVIVATPAVRFPLSRQRLALCVFLESWRQAGYAYIASLAGALLGISAACIIAGQPIHAEAFARPVAALMLLPTALGFLLVGKCLLGRWLYLLLAASPILAILAAGFMGVRGEAGQIQILAKLNLLTEFLLSPLGWLVCLAVTGFGAWLHWLALQREFRKKDLSILDARFVNPGLAPWAMAQWGVK